MCILHIYWIWYYPNNYWGCIITFNMQIPVCQINVFQSLNPLEVQLYYCSTSQVGDADIFSCDQAALRTPLSVYLSVTPFSLCSCHRIIMKFSGVITIDKSNVHAWGQGQRSKVRVTRDKKSPILTQIGRFRTVTPIWIYQWLRNDAQSLK